MKKNIPLIAIVVFIVDYISKFLIVNYFNNVTLIPDFLNINYVINTGAALSILNNNISFVIILNVIIFGLLIFYQRKFKNTRLVCTSFGFIYGGLFGNLINRIVKGYVIDFISFKLFGYNCPIFNVADIFICVGVVLLIIAICRGEDHETRSRR